LLLSDGPPVVGGGVGCCRVVPAPGFAGVALATCAAFWLQKSMSALEGWAAEAAPPSVPIATTHMPMNLGCFMEPSFGNDSVDPDKVAMGHG
jgi:hypothetical protein